MEQAIPVMRYEVFQIFKQKDFLRVQPEAFGERCLDELPDFKM